jgi:hypothetical protein
MNFMRKRNVCVCICPVTVCSHYLAVMCIYAIYKCLSWGSDQQEDLGKPSRKQQSQAINGKLLSVLSHVVSETTQSALRVRMDSFAVVLPAPGYSSMYEAECELMSCGNE